MISIFTIPPVMLGDAPKLTTMIQRGEHELTYAESFANHHGLNLHDLPLSEDARYVLTKRQMRQSGLQP